MAKRNAGSAEAGRNTHHACIECGRYSVAMAQPMFLSENGHCVPNKIPKILKIFESVEGAKSRGPCLGTKELDCPLLGYSDGFDFLL